MILKCQENYATHIELSVILTSLYNLYLLACDYKCTHAAVRKFFIFSPSQHSVSENQSERSVF